MGAPVDVRLLCRAWLRSRHEDTGGEEVYRPAGSAAAGRGRSPSGYRFNADGTVDLAQSGATDVPAVATGVWRVDEAHPDRVRVVVGGHEQVLEVVALAPDRLSVREVPSADGP